MRMGRRKGQCVRKGQRKKQCVRERDIERDRRELCENGTVCEKRRETETVCEKGTEKGTVGQRLRGSLMTSLYV